MRIMKPLRPKASLLMLLQMTRTGRPTEQRRRGLRASEETKIKFEPWLLCPLSAQYVHLGKTGTAGG